MTTYFASGTRLTCENGLIAAVQTDATAEPGDVSLQGHLLPGFANSHSHAFHRALRGRTHSSGTFFTWREQMYALAAALTPDSYYELATAVFAEMLLAGYTVVGEFHYLHDRGMDDAVRAAASTAGIRLSLLDTLYLRGGLPRFADGSARAWLDRRAARPGPTLEIQELAAIHSVRAVDLRAVLAATPEFPELLTGVPLHAHVSEQPAENEFAREKYGATPVELFAEAGLLGPNFTAVHATHLTNSDIELLHDSSVCFCPTTERDLADGIGPARALFDSGTRLCLGSDQHAILDPFEELRGLEMNERLASGQRGRFTPAQLLDAATANGYASLGWNGGRLEVGAVADFVTVDPVSVRTAGAAPDQLVLAAAASDVLNVVVGGRLVVDNRQHALGDVGEALRKAIA